MEERYKALRVIGTIYKVLGVIIGALTLLAALAICASTVLGGAALDQLGREFAAPGPTFGLFGGVLSAVLINLFVILYGGAIAVTLYGFGEGVYLLLALEENTRATAQLLRGQGGSS